MSEALRAKLHTALGIGLLLVLNGALTFVTAGRALVLIRDQDLVQWPYLIVSVCLVLLSATVAFTAKGLSRKAWVILSVTLILVALLVGGIWGLAGEMAKSQGA